MVVHNNTAKHSLCAFPLGDFTSLSPMLLAWMAGTVM